MKVFLAQGDDATGFAMMVHALIADNVSRWSWPRLMAMAFRGCVVLRARDEDSVLDVLVKRDGKGILVADVHIPLDCPVVAAPYDTWTRLTAVPFRGPVPAFWKRETLDMVLDVAKGTIRISGPSHLLRILFLLGMTQIT